MKTLAEIARFLKLPPKDSWGGISADHICLDSRQVKSGSIFCAFKGLYEDGISFIPDAVSKGAVAILHEPVHNLPQINVPYIEVDNLAEKIFELGPFFYDYPSRQINMIGVTGTNGKTSTTHYIAELLSLMGKPCAVIGTVGNGLWGELDETNCTTPDPLNLQYLIANLKAKGAQYIAMEVSSHGLDQRRVAGVEFDVAIFTNLTRDHLDYHQTFEKYAHAKAKLFSYPGLGWAILNQDDASSALMTQNMSPATKTIWYSANNDQKADIYIKHCAMQTKGIEITLTGKYGESKCYLPLLGQFNISNVIAAMSALFALGLSLASIEPYLAKLRPVKGRMELITRPNSPTVVIDFAHTPDALEKALQAIRAHCHGKIWVVFGCGGSRDRGKRPEMAKAAEKFADEIIVTQDNSRLENPTDIFADIMQGFSSKVPYVEADRKKAIEYTLAHAHHSDCILLAGKGHENYMDFQGKKTYFDEHEIVNEILNTRNNK